MDSLKKFSYFNGNIDNYLKKTAEIANNESIEQASELLRESSRIFITGSGTSVASVDFFVASMAQSKTPFSIIKVSTSELLSYCNIGKKDSIILISQGFNRSDALIVRRYAELKKAKFILITANRDRLDADAVIRFLPTAEDERIFSRPCGAITSMFITSCLVSKILESVFSNHRFTDSTFLKENQLLPQILLKSENIIILYSGEVKPGAENLALTLREGAKKISSSFEIEYYAHGQYVPHLMYFNKNKETALYYLIILNEDNKINCKSVERIMPLIEKVGVPYSLINVKGDILSSNLTLLKVGSDLVEALNKITLYDMNNPIGKEENRGFQLVSEDYYN